MGVVVFWFFDSGLVPLAEGGGSSSTSVISFEMTVIFAPGSPFVFVVFLGRGVLRTPLVSRVPKCQQFRLQNFFTKSLTRNPLRRVRWVQAVESYRALLVLTIFAPRKVWGSP